MANTTNTGHDPRRLSPYYKRVVARHTSSNDDDNDDDDYSHAFENSFGASLGSSLLPTKRKHDIQQEQYHVGSFVIY